MLHPDVALDVFVMAVGPDKDLPIKVVIIGEIRIVEVLDTVKGFSSGIGAVEGTEVEDI